MTTGTVGASLVEFAAGSAGVVIAAAIAAFADAHASAASIASVFAVERLTSGAAVAVLACVSTNTITKTVLAFTSGGRAHSIPVFIRLAIVITATWGGWALSAALF